ncbi:Vitamin B12-dependent ribonucleotide reductase [compost metagenome]
MVIGHDNIKSSTSVIDYIFRLLGYEYLNRTDLVHVITKQNASLNNPQLIDEDINPDKNNVFESSVINTRVTSDSSEMKFKSLDISGGVQSDAPACNTCGHITVRSGTCYKCLNCGNSLGCS